MGEKNQDKFSVDEILEEHREQQKRVRVKKNKESAATGLRMDETADIPKKPAANADEPIPQPPAKQQEENLPVQLRQEAAREGNPYPENYQEEGEKPRGGIFGLFGKKKKKKKPAFVEGEEETFYGIQLKPIDEYRKGYNQVTGEFSIDADSYATLFEESKKAIDGGEVEKNFERIQRERSARTAGSMEFTAQRGKIVPPSHAEQAVRDEAAQKPEAKQIQKEGTSTQSIKKSKKSPSEGRLQVIPKINSVYEYRSHGIPTHIVNVKVLQDVLKSKEMYRTTIPGVNTAKQRQKPAVSELPVVQEIPVNTGNALDTSDIYREKPAVQAAEQNAAPQIKPEEMQTAEPKADTRADSNTVPQPEQETKVLTQTQPPVQPNAQERVQPPAPRREKPVQRQAQPAAQQPGIGAKLPPDHPLAARQVDQSTKPIPNIRQEAVEDKTREIPAVPKDDIQANAENRPAVQMTDSPTMKIPKLPGQGKKKTPEFEDFILDEDAMKVIKESSADRQDDVDVKDADVKEVKGGRKQNAVKWVEPEESVEDYNGPEDAKAVSDELKSDMRDLTLRTVITVGCTLLLALINVIFGGRFSSGQADLGSTPYVYIVLTMILLGVAIAVNFRTIFNGLRALADFNPTSDSAVALATLGVCIQAVLSFFFTSSIVDKEQHLYAAVLTAVLVANAAGKLTMLRRIHSNFRFVTSKEQKYAVHACENEEIAGKMAGNVVADTPVLVYQNKTGFLKRFLEMSYLPDPAETSSQMLAPIGLIASLVLCILCMLITKSIPSAIAALAAGLITSVAVTNMLAVNMPVSRLSKLARRAGGMIVGYEAVQKFGEANAVAVDAQELFPTGTVTLNGIKTYQRRDDVEEAILAASALVDVVGGPLCGVFEQVITENEEMLPRVESFEYEHERGMIGRVDGRYVYVGNRALLLNHRIEIPAKEEEAQYAVGGKQVLYIAVDNQVVAMMVMTYTADRRKKNEIQRLEDSGISVVVRSTDPNLTVQMLSRLFGVDVLSVSIMDGDMSSEYQEFMNNDLARSDAILATKGRIESFMSILSACVKERRGVNLIVMLQTIAVVLGFVLVAFVACLGGIGNMTSLFLFMFEAVCAAVIILVPKLRR